MEETTPVFTPDEVESLNQYQQAGAFHPFTCGNDRCRADLVAEQDGWHCPQCGYRQDWAHGWMKNWAWLKAAYSSLLPWELQQKREQLILRDGPV